MLTRIITAIVALCVLIPVLLLSNTWVFPIAVAVACVIATCEALKCVGVLNKFAVSVPLIAVAAVAPLFARFSGAIEVYFVALACVVLVEILYFMGVLVFSKGSLGIVEISVSAFVCFYVLIGFNSIVLLHDCFGSGHYTYLLIFVGAWVTDVFAYFCGRLFGKHKLIPEISPKKTVEGSIGGTLFSGLAFVLFGFIVSRLNLGVEQGYIQLFIFGIIAALIAQIGDLCMSALKRHYGIKDFGKVFPGHGGMLDRFDSIISVSTVLLVLNILVSYIL